MRRRKEKAILKILVKSTGIEEMRRMSSHGLGAKHKKIKWNFILQLYEWYTATRSRRAVLKGYKAAAAG